MTPGSPLTAALEVAINRYLALDPSTPAELETLHGRTVALEVRGLGVERFLEVRDGSIHVHESFEGEVDAHISATPLALLRMGLAGSDSRLLFEGDVQVSGDSSVGQRLQSVLEHVDIDWEEQLSHLIGDVAAHKAGNAARDSIRWAGRTHSTLEKDVGEYLQVESDMLPGRNEVEAFLTAVDTLRSDMARLDARLERLERVTRTEAGEEGQ